jgi:hypothetical protein
VNDEAVGIRTGTLSFHLVEPGAQLGTGRAVAPLQYMADFYF